MAVPSNLCYALLFLLVSQTLGAPTSSSRNADQLCSSAKLIAPGQSSLVYKYTTEVKMSVANGQFDLENEYSADVHIRSLGECNYALQLRNVKITEQRDERKTTVSATNAAQRALENTVVRFRWSDGFLLALEADASAKIENVNFIKGVLSALQVQSPIPVDGENTVREEDVLGVCTTHYKYVDQGATLQVKKTKELNTCSKDKLHLGASPVLTSLLGPLIEEAFTAKSRYVCQTEIRDKSVQSVKCKTVEVDEDKDKSGSGASDDDSSEEANDDDDQEISTKLVSIKQELKLQSGAAANVDVGSIRKADRQTLQFVPIPSFDRSNQPISSLIQKLQSLADSKGWNEFAASQFVQVTNELRRMERGNLNAFKNNADLRHLTPSLLKTVYASDPAAAPLNFDPRTMKFLNPMSVYYLDDPSPEFVDQIVQASKQITNAQVRDFVGLAATILKTYKNRETHNQDADAKIREFQKSISRFLEQISKERAPEIVAVLAAYAQLGLYEERVRRLAMSEQAPMNVQHQAFNVIRHISEDYIDKDNLLKIRTDLQNVLLRRLQNKNNRNAVRIWAFEALYTPFIFNPEEDDPTLSDNLEKALETIVNEPLDQVNGYIWSVLKYSSLDRRCPLRGLAARLRTHLADKKKYTEQATLSSRQIQLDIPLRKNYRAALEASIIFENDRATPSFLSLALSFDGVRRETRRLDWFKAALIVENLDWNVADYFLKLDPLNTKQDDETKEKLKSRLPSNLKKLQDGYDNKEEDPDPNVHLVLQLFGADFRIGDVTDKVQDILRDNIRSFLRNALLNRMKDLGGEKPIYRLPLEIGAATAAANGLTLYRAAQLGILADLTNEFKNTRDENGEGDFLLNSKSAISLSLTLTREVSSPMSAVGETIQIGVLSNIPFEYSTAADPTGRIRQFSFPNEQSTALSTDFQYLIRTANGIEALPNSKSSGVEPSCSPSVLYRTLGIKLCLELNPFRSIQLGSRASYPLKITLSKDPSIKKWRIGWRFNAKDAPQYEVAVEKVGTTATYPGLGLTATKNGNNFDIKFLTGMKSFNVKGTQNGDRFNGKVYSSDGKEVMTTTGTLSINNDGFKLNSKLAEIGSGREVLNVATEILPNKGDGLTLNVGLTTPDNSKSFKIHFRGDLYKTQRKLFHLTGGFNLGQASYDGKVHLERDDAHTHIELHRSIKLGPSAFPTGYNFVYERKNQNVNDGTTQNIKSHIALSTPRSADPMKIAEFKADFTRSNDKSNADLQSTLDFLLMTRDPPVQERISLDYNRKSVKPANQAKRLLSPQAQLKLQLKTKSNFFNVLLDHRHRRSSEPSQKGPVTLPPTLEIENKIHIAADSDKLLPDIPRPFAFEVLSDLDFDLLNKIDYKAEYNFPRRQRSASLLYSGQIDRVVDNHHFYGTSRSELLWDNKQKKASATGAFSICTRSRTLTTHWDIDTNLVPDRKDAELDLVVRFDRQAKLNAPKSFIGAYNLSIKAPKHEALQSLDLQGNLTRQEGLLETYNSVAFRKGPIARHLNLNAIVQRNRTGDGSLKTNVVISLPLKYLPYITHELTLERDSPSGRVSHIRSQLLAEPVTSHFLDVDIDRSDASRPPKVFIENEFEYLRTNGDNLYGLSQINVHRWTSLHSMGLLKRNTDLLHKHSIGYIFSKKTRKVALSLESPQISGNPLSIIGELTIDRENRIGKMKWPQEFGVHIELGTPITSLTALHAFYNLPMFGKDDEQTVDGTIGLKIASSKIDPISLYIHSRGSLNTTLHITESLRVGNDIALSSLLTAQYNPKMATQVSLSANTKYYGRETHNSIFALFKQHQITVRGVLNTTDYKDYRYEMDIGYDSDALIGHTERSDGEQTVVSDIDAKRCNPTGKYVRCYRGDIVVRAGDNARGNRGSFDVSWGSGTAKLDVQVPNGIELKFDHTHTGRVRDYEFNSKTNIEAKLLQTGQKGSFSYSGLIDKQEGKWNTVKVAGSVSDPRTGQKAFGTRINIINKNTDRRTGAEQRTVEISYERAQPILDWSSQSVSCPSQGNEILHGICRTINFKVKANNEIVKRLRERLDLPADPRLSNPSGQVDYDGKLQLDLKADPKRGPHTAVLDLNRLNDDAVDLNLSFQPRSADTPMAIKLKCTLPRQTPISVNYAENLRSATNYKGVLKYSFNADDSSAEKTYECEVDRPSLEDFSIDCKGERTTLAIDIDRNAGKSKVYVDLNRFAGERVGYELQRNPQTQKLDATLYTFVSSWNIQREPGRSTTLSVKQKNSEVLRVEGVKVGSNEIQVKFSPSGVNLKAEWHKDGILTVKQTAPTQRDIFSIYVNRAQIRPYLPSLRNQDRPSLDIDEPKSQSKRPLVEIAFGPHVFLALSQALDKIGSHNGLYGLDTIKKVYKLTIGDATVTVYNTQHWKAHGEDSQLPESYAVRIVNDLNGNILQLSTQRWDETRMISKIGHSFDGGKTLTTDLKIDRNYGVEVGSLYFFRSIGYRNIEGMKNLRNFTRHFVKSHLMNGLKETGAAQLAHNFRARLRSILEVDYAAAKEVVQAWNKEPEKSFLRRWSNRVGLVEFFSKYPTYKDASDAVQGILMARHEERINFWRNRTEAILNENRLQSLTERVEKVREKVIEYLSARAEALLERLLPPADQAAIDKRIVDYVAKLLDAFKKFSTRNREGWKMIFKAIDDASKGPANQWFRTLVADIDSAAFAAASDAESAKLFKRLDDSSKLFINNLQQISRRITKRRESIRERVRNAIRHVPRVYMNGTHFELLFPVGRQPGSYVGTSELLLGIGSLIRNRDQAFDTIRSILVNRLEARTESLQNYLKAVKSLVKRLFKRNPSLTPEFKGFITETGDALNVQTDYMYLNPACDYVLAHDFADLKFSFRFSNGKVYSMLPTETEIKEYQCSDTGRVQVCCDKDFCTLNVPMYYGGRVDGALGDVRDRSGRGHLNLNKWLLRDCPEARRPPPRRDSTDIPECADVNDDNVKFCNGFVQDGLRSGKSKYELLAQVIQARREAA